MGFLDQIQGFVHSVTTNDHYAPYKDDHGRPHGSSSGARTSESGVSMINNSSTSSLPTQQGSARTSSGGPVQYNPGMRTQQAMDGSRTSIQMQDYINGQPPLPTITEVWDRLETWLENEFPELGDDVQDGATTNDLNAIEKDLGISLPLDVRDSYKLHDGQVSLGKMRGLVYGYPLLDLESIAAETNIWRRVCGRLEKKDELYLTGNKSSASFQHQKATHEAFLAKQSSVPEGAIQELYCHPDWIPIVKDGVGNNIAIDLSPSTKGRWGQVILFGRDYDTKYVVASCFTEFLYNLLQDLEDGKFDIDDDENIVYQDRRAQYEYFDVLRMRSLAQYKPKAAPAPTVSVTDEHVPEKPKVSLPKETLLSPAVKSPAKFAEKEEAKEEVKEEAKDEPTDESKDEVKDESSEPTESAKPAESSKPAESKAESAMEDITNELASTSIAK